AVPDAVTLKLTFAPPSTVWLAGCVVITGGAVTVSGATALVTAPATFVTRKVYAPASLSWTFEIVSDVLVAPEMRVPLERFVPLSRHWYAKGAVPIAVALKIATEPAKFVVLCGGAVICGGSRTVKIAALLVTVTLALVTTTL